MEKHVTGNGFNRIPQIVKYQPKWKKPPRKTFYNFHIDNLRPIHGIMAMRF